MRSRDAAVTLTWTAAHTEGTDELSIGNEEADRLATLASRKTPPSTIAGFREDDALSRRRATTGNPKVLTNVPKVPGKGHTETRTEPTTNFQEARALVASVRREKGTTTLPVWLSRLHHAGKQVRRAIKNIQLEALMNTTSERQHWQLLRQIMGTTLKLPKASLEDQQNASRQALTVSSPLPPTYAEPQWKLMEWVESTIPDRTSPTCLAALSTASSISDHPLEKRITADEVEWLKSRLHGTGRHTSRTRDLADIMSWEDTVNLPNGGLRDLFNLCLVQNDAPDAELATKVIGLAKPKEDSTDARNLRYINIKSVLLRALTSILERRISQWSDAGDVLQHAQNGFCAGRRTEDHVFFLQTLHAKQTLFVAFVDFKNAFPSVHRATLWVKLRNQGAGGRVFDLLRTVYKRMQYFQFKGKDWSTSYEAEMGVMQGDPTSTALWNFYISDLRFPAHPDDPVLAALRIASLLHADDLSLMSHSAEGLQTKLDHLGGWSSNNFLTVSDQKTQIMVLGTPPRELPRFHIYGRNLPYTDIYQYLGITLYSPLRAVTEPHLMAPPAFAFAVVR